MDKITIWFIAVFVVVIVAVVIIAGVMSGGFDTGTANGTPAGFVATTVPPIGRADWARGNANAPVSLIEYGDYECPACGEYEPIVEQLLQNYGTKINFSFRNFPLYSNHPDAGISAQAAEAAGREGKFWEMHDLLYAKQNEWVNTPPGQVVQQNFNGYAQSLGLNVAAFDKDINSSAVMSKIQNDVTTANAASVDHTPTFFVNNVQIPNPANYGDFAKVLDQAIAAAGEGSSTAPLVTVSSTPLTVTSTPAK